MCFLNFDLDGDVVDFGLQFLRHSLKKMLKLDLHGLIFIKFNHGLNKLFRFEIFKYAKINLLAKVLCKSPMVKEFISVN